MRLGTIPEDFEPIVENYPSQPNYSKEECVVYVFSFDLQLTFDAAIWIDLDGSGAATNFSYALGTSEYEAATLFYNGKNG